MTKPHATRLAISTESSPILSPAALGNMEPAVQALYENVHLKLQADAPLLTSERVALEERLSELWEEHGITDDEVALPPHCTLVLLLHHAHRAAHAEPGPQQAQALLHLLIEAEEFRAYLEHHPHARPWDDCTNLGDWHA